MKSNSSLTVDNSKLDGNLQTLPIHGSLLDIITDLLGSLMIKNKTTKSPTIPRGPTLGARAAGEADSPPTARR